MTRSIVIAGRPNVGKSTLFNRLAGKRLALVDDMPGLTRDRKEAEAQIGRRILRLSDTAGLEEAEQGSIAARMSDQSRNAILAVTSSLIPIEHLSGVTPADEQFALHVRASNRPVTSSPTNRKDAPVSRLLRGFKLGWLRRSRSQRSMASASAKLYSRISEVLDELEAQAATGPNRDERG